jgi:hypothetical protein
MNKMRRAERNSANFKDNENVKYRTVEGIWDVTLLLFL